jgi:DUF3102 family protein
MSEADVTSQTAMANSYGIVLAVVLTGIKGVLQMTEIHSNPDHHPADRGIEKYNAEGACAFDYGSLSPEIAKALREKTDRIRQSVKHMNTSIVWIGRDLLAVKQMLEHGQFVHWVAKECGFGIRTAQNYKRAAEFLEGKSATVALLPPATLYRLSAKNVPPEVVDAVINRAAGGEISEADVVRIFGEYNNLKRGAARKEREAKECVKANVQEILKRFGPDGAAFLLGIRKDLFATLSLLEREISTSAAPDQGGTA